MTVPTSREPVADAGRPVVLVGLVAAPGASAQLAAGLAGDLATELGSRHPEVSWQVETVEDGLVQPPADDAELVAATGSGCWPPTGTSPSA